MYKGWHKCLIVDYSMISSHEIFPPHLTATPLLPLPSVQSSFRIMDMCHSRPANAVFDALNQNTIHFSRPPVAPTASSGLPLGYSNIPVHTQVRYCSHVCLLLVNLQSYRSRACFTSALYFLILSVMIFIGMTEIWIYRHHSQFFLNY